MLITAIIGLVAGIVVVSILGLWSARTAARGKSRASQTTGATSELVVNKMRKMTNDASRDLNKDNPEAMKMAEGGDTKNEFLVQSTKK